MKGTDFLSPLRPGEQPESAAMGESLLTWNQPEDKEALIKRFYELVSPSLPNEWEVEVIIDEVVDLPDTARQLLFSQIPVIWPVSNSLCLSFIEDGSHVIETIPVELIPKWVRAILRRYEQKGLASARELIVNADHLFLSPLKKHNLVRFDDVRKRMLWYIRGVSGEDIDIALNEFSFTNTTTLYVPTVITLLDTYQKNQLLYKYLLTLHWGFDLLGTFKTDTALVSEPASESETDNRGTDTRGSMGKYLAEFNKPELAADLFFLLETGRVMHWLKKDLPGLAFEFNRLQDDLRETLSGPAHDHLGGNLTSVGFSILFEGKIPYWLSAKLSSSTNLPSSAEQSRATVKLLYDVLENADEPYERPPLLTLLGKHDFAKATAEIERKRTIMKETFVLHLQALKTKHEHSSQHASTPLAHDDADQALAIISDTETDGVVPQFQQILDNPEIDLPEELVDLINQIKDDLGHIPPSYFSAASGVPGDGFERRDVPSSAGGEGLDSQGGILLDEWDYRRNGYRKNWCRIYEREISLLHSTFVDTTLDKHRGLLIKLRRQFEFMKTNEHFVRRQREGDDLDLDAIVEARGDMRAGISPSSKLFVRLQRNERDIATIFLVDMSNSTEGWVGTVIKEALVLLCEVMDVAGDPYGILGFSGMRRSRCDLYRIKDIEEPYNRLIHQRINSIQPREYTRMGPALRYAADTLKQYEARTRLLVTITDGKPEDYDDYKGEYAIEDTRKA
ncbi:MAG: VWA domain-containing protein, partial [Desulfofustis sp.]|nr:VWA domain-containing protein [Desulfofustis sp.]